MSEIEVFDRFGKLIDLKNHPIIVTETWLPLFPGFYETIYSPNVVVQSYCDDYLEDGYNSDIEVEIDSERWKRDIAKLFIKEFHKAANDSFYEYVNVENDWDNGRSDNSSSKRKRYTYKMIHSIEFQEIYSPKEYNFSTDSINIIVGFTAENIANIISFVTGSIESCTKQEKLDSDIYSCIGYYIDEKFTKAPGFIPKYSNNLLSSDWVDLYSCLCDTEKCGHILECLFSVCAKLSAQEDILDWSDITENLNIEDYIIFSNE
ncbi:MAG TPA: hypothetical protein ENG48_09125 [Candidatus Atribacteria bacterium]|nr:hypothetical protein [Candidatus Atribacteria bacterium]